MELRIGQLVRHPKYGLGKVVKIDGMTVHVFFRDFDRPYALKFKTGSAPLIEAPEAADPWLDNLPPFDEKDGMLCLSEKRITQAQAVAKFQRLFPQGFDDPDYLGNAEIGERNYKLTKHEEFVKTLGNGEGRRLLAAGDLRELIRRTRRVTSTNLTSIPEKAAFGDALIESEETRRYFDALFSMLEAEPNEASVTSYFNALQNLPQKQGRVDTWPIATLLPFLADPARHMFLKPTITQEAEARLGFYLCYKPHPNWLTYKKLLELADLLLEQLRPLGARDYLDVQSFMWIASKYDESAVKVVE